MKLPSHRCPCCGNLLSAEDDGSGRQVAFCGNGRCASELGDNGALGDTPEQAATNLIKQMNDERDWE